MDDQKLADVLYRRGVERLADTLEHLVARAPVVAEHADLDEAVGEEIDIDLVKHGRCEAVAADHDDGVEMMRFRAQRTPLSGGELKLHAMTACPLIFVAWVRICRMLRL
jgi:hypothetical protein